MDQPATAPIAGRTERAGHARVELLVLQPTPFCNLDCRYCYLPGRSDRRRMSDVVLTAIAGRIVQEEWAMPELTIVWHAGEPLVLPPKWYERAFELLDRGRSPSVRLRHAVQTNGVLIDDRWIELFRRHDVQVGLSIDGPKHLHDRARVDRAGRGSFDAAMAGLRRLASAGLEFSVISVLTDRSLDAADELFAFYADNGIRRVGLNIEEIEGVHTASSLDGAATERRFRAFLDRLWTLAEANPGLVRFREIEGAAGAVLDPVQDGAGNPIAEPLRLLTVDVDGHMSTFSPELAGAPFPDYDRFRFGNVRDGGPELMLRHAGFRRADAAIRAGLEACRAACPFYRLCHGGAPANKLFEAGDLAASETFYCRLAKQAVLSVAIERLERRLPADALEAAC